MEVGESTDLVANKGKRHENLESKSETNASISVLAHTSNDLLKHKGMQRSAKPHPHVGTRRTKDDFLDGLFDDMFDDTGSDDSSSIYGNHATITSDNRSCIPQQLIAHHCDAYCDFDCNCDCDCRIVVESKVDIMLRSTRWLNIMTQTAITTEL